MKKIPTLLKRNPEDRSKVLDEINPGCEWVLAGEGVATRKFDGHGMMRDDKCAWYSRREVKTNRPVPDGYILEDFDIVTGKSQGWEPVEQSPFYKFFLEAMNMEEKDLGPGTYELIGPKINGNPERVLQHMLIRHGLFRYELPYPIDVEQTKRFVDALGRMGSEGLVWHHSDGRMAKLKYRDLK